MISGRRSGAAVLPLGGLLAGLLSGCADAGTLSGGRGASSSSSRAPDAGGTGPSPAPPPGTGAAVGRPVTLRSPPDAQPARVDRHVDGDTLVLTGRGPGVLPARPTRVRLLQIDTPEVFERPECFGRQAAERTAGLLPEGADVRVQADVDPRDRFGRTLVLSWTQDGASVQEVLLAEGMARVQAVGRNRAGLQELRAVERQARRERRGLWGAC